MSYNSNNTKQTRTDSKQTIAIDVDGEEEEYHFAEGTPVEEITAFAESRMGIEPDAPTEVDHPDFAFADVPSDESPQLEGFRTVCRMDGCHETEVFDSINAIKDSDWTELEFGVGVLTDMTDLHYGFCPGHSLSDEEGYEPEEDPGSHEYPAPDGVRALLEVEEAENQ